MDNCENFTKKSQFYLYFKQIDLQMCIFPGLTLTHRGKTYVNPKYCLSKYSWIFK